MSGGDHCAVWVVIMIEGTQRNKKFFLTLEYYDSTRPRIRKMDQSYKSWSIYSYKEYKGLLKSLWARLQNLQMSYTNTVNERVLCSKGQAYRK